MPRQIWRRKPTEIEVEYVDPDFHVPHYVIVREHIDKGNVIYAIMVDERELTIYPPTYIVFQDNKPVGFIHPEQLKRDYTIVHRKWANHAFDWHAGVDEEEMETAISGLGLKTPAN
jgi:hypothetical protein